MYSHNVPYAKKILSFFYLYTYQSRPFCWYCRMEYSKNRRTFPHYSGIIGAFLQTADYLLLTIVGIIHLALCLWLAPTKSSYLSAYHSNASQLLAHNSPTVWPHVSDSNNEFITPVNPSDIVVPSYVFPDKRHNEDAYYSRLAIGFFQEYKRQIPLRFNNPELEAKKGIVEMEEEEKRSNYQHLAHRNPIFLSR